MLRQTSLIAVLLLGGCASSPEPTRDPKVDQQLEGAMTEREELAKQLAKMPTQEQQRCEFLVGDCLLLVSDRREELLAAKDNPPLECGSAEPEERAKCLGRQVLALGTTAQAQRTADFYHYEAECLGELVACMRGEDPVTAQRNSAKERRRELEASADAIAARTAVEVAEARAEHVRKTLPSLPDGVCGAGTAQNRCPNESQGKMKELEALLGKAEGYDAQAAVALYKAGKESEAACYDADRECLSAKAKSYGANSETRRLLDKSLALLEERARLTLQVNEQAFKQCLADTEGQHEGAISKRHQAYARNRTTFYRYQLNQAYLDLHSSQVRCLKDHLGDSPAGQPTAVSAR